MSVLNAKNDPVKKFRFRGTDRSEAMLHEQQSTDEQCFLERFVKSQTFDCIAGAAIASNSVMIGLETDYQARHIGQPEHAAFIIGRWIFFVIFNLELLLRIVAYRKNFFFSRTDWKWNYFDIIMVLSSWAEVLVDALGND